MSVPVIFLLKKILGTVLMPVPLCLIGAAAGLLLLWRRRAAGMSHLGLAVTGTAVAALLIASLPILPATIHTAILPDAPPALPDTLPYVVVLSGGLNGGQDLSSVSRLTSSTMARLAEGVRITRAHSEARLIVTGGGRPGWRSTAAVMRDAAIELGIDPDRIIVEDESRDTSDHADFLVPVLNDAHFALVTSARHIPRSLLLFRQRGLHPIPVYADRAYSGDPDFGIGSFIPTAHHLAETTHLAHEGLGIIWARLTGD